jgi:hypothetical protein
MSSTSPTGLLYVVAAAFLVACSGGHEPTSAGSEGALTATPSSGAPGAVLTVNGHPCTVQSTLLTYDPEQLTTSEWLLTLTASCPGEAFQSPTAPPQPVVLRAKGANLGAYPQRTGTSLELVTNWADLTSDPSLSEDSVIEAGPDFNTIKTRAAAVKGRGSVERRIAGGQLPGSDAVEMVTFEYRP